MPHVERGPGESSVAAFESLLSAIARLDVAKANAAELESFLPKVRDAQRSLDGLTTHVGVRLNQLAANGQSAPAAEVLRGDGSVSATQARREAKRCELAHHQPAVSAALAAGSISGEHVDALARRTGQLTDEQRGRFDFAAAISDASRLPPETFNRLLKRRVDRIRADGGLEDDTSKQQASEFHHWFDHGTGMGRFAGSLDPERYEQLTAAIEQRCASLAAEGDVEKSNNLAAQALIDLMANAGANSRSQGHGQRPSILVVVDHKTARQGWHTDTICQTENGHDISTASLARLACDATVRSVTLDPSGVPINVGRTYRTATNAQWAALKSIYSTCAWDGCTAPISWCQAHHIHEWEHGGATDLNNLIPLCSQHHHRVHEGGWSILLGQDRSLQIWSPDRTLRASTGPPSRSAPHRSPPQPNNRDGPVPGRGHPPTSTVTTKYKRGVDDEKPRRSAVRSSRPLGRLRARSR
jgi:hypothetical protein